MNFLRYLVVLVLSSILFSAPLATATPGPAVLPVSLVPVSGANPYASCTVGAGQDSVNYLNNQVEPYVAINPANPRNIIGVWQQDRWSDGGAHGLVAGYSLDGGATWSQTPLPFSSCANGLHFDRASDPWVSIGPDGTVYAVSISFSPATGASAVGAATSTDGGATWQHVSTIISDVGHRFFNDKEAVTADPTKPGVAYVVWDRLASTGPQTPFGRNLESETGPGYFSMTTDGGATWSPPSIIGNVATGQQTVGNQIVVDPRDGTLYDFFATNSASQNDPGFDAAFVKSTDGGNTWSDTHHIGSLKGVPVSGPEAGEKLRTGSILPEAAIDPNTGELYVVWQDARFTDGKYDEVALSTSSDGGATWTAPVRVNKPTGTTAFTPMVNVSSDGTVGVTYYAFRELTGQSMALPTDYWLALSTDHGATFGSEVQISGPFDMLRDTSSGGLFVGDYEGLGVSGKSFRPFFSQPGSDNGHHEPSIYSTSVMP